MAHQVESMAYNFEGEQAHLLPWHGLGTPSNGLMTAQEVLSLAGLDWEVTKEPLIIPNGDIVPNKYATVRNTDSRVLGVVGEQYLPLQNSEAFKFFDTVVERDEAVYETAGSLAGGKKVWLLAKLPDYVRVGNGDDVVEKYVLLTNTHDGSKPVIAKITPVRVVCNNTLNLALNTKRGMDEVSVRHSTNMVMNLEVASKTIGLVNKIYSQVEDIFNAMSESKLTVMEGEAYVKKALQLTTSKDAPEELVTQSKITFDSVMGLVEHGAGTDMPMVKGTLWGYYNAVTEYVDHYRVLNKKTERMDALVFGSGAIIKERSLAVAKQYLEGAMM